MFSRTFKAFRLLRLPRSRRDRRSRSVRARPSAEALDGRISLSDLAATSVSLLDPAAFGTFATAPGPDQEADAPADSPPGQGDDPESDPDMGETKDQVNIDVESDAGPAIP